MATSISSSIIACLKSFNEFIEDIRHPQEENVAGLVAGAWEDELGRLRLWAANIGAQQTGQSSLDFRLRDASHVREQIIRLLQSLLRRLQDVRDVLADDEKSDDEGAADDPLNGEDLTSEIQELQESIATNINCLFQMSTLVRKPAQHDVYLGSKRADVAAFELSDYDHVREKYPEADDVLVKRLGNATTRRRKHLKYRERHAAKLRQGMSNVDTGLRDLQHVHEGEIMTLGTISHPIAEDFEQRNIDFDDKASDTGTSQTFYAPTLLSVRKVAIPRPPKTSLGGVPFECPYCFYLITVNGSRSWNKHVFQDLQPYVCMSRTCTTPDKLYSTRHEWLYHSKMAHPAAMTDDDKPKERTGVSACPLCKEEAELGKQFDRHLARHLQELALFILPVGDEDSDVGEDQDAESSSDADSVHLTAAYDRSESPKGLPASPVEHSAAVEAIDFSYGKQKHKKDEYKKDEYTEEEREEKMILQEKEVKERQRLLGPEHRDTLTSMAELASLYYTERRYEEALHWIKQVMEMKRRLLGGEHPETLQTVYELAQIHGAQERWADAEVLYQQTLDASTKILGSDYNNTIHIVCRLACVYAKLGRLSEAEVKYRQALKMSEEALGPDHVTTLIAAQDLGHVYETQGKLVEAEEVYHPILNGYQKALGPDHTTTLKVAKDLGNCYDKQGKLAEAEKIYQQVLDGYKKALGPIHPTTLRAAQDLGDSYVKRGILTEAEDIYQQALSGFKKITDLDDRIILLVLVRLGILYQKQGNLAEAKEMYQQGLARSEKSLGPKHQITLSVAQRLENLYEQPGELAEAEEIYPMGYKETEKWPPS